MKKELDDEPTHQITFCTELALESLKFVKSEVVK